MKRIGLMLATFVGIVAFALQLAHKQQDVVLRERLPIR